MLAIIKMKPPPLPPPPLSLFKHSHFGLIVAANISLCIVLPYFFRHFSAFAGAKDGDGGWSI